MMALRGELLRLGMQLGVDLAVQKDDIFRRTEAAGFAWTSIRRS